VRRLILAEKFSAALRLATILSEGMAKRVRADGVTHFRFSKGGDETLVLPLRGHIVEVDYSEGYRDWATVDLAALVDVDPVRRESPAAIHDRLRALAPSVDEVILATDYDREGELIGMESLETLRAVRPDLPARRARFSAMTGPEIRKAFASLTEPDTGLAEAALAREWIDLAWGAVLTRFLTLACGTGRQVISAGRVQTPTLALVVEREREREDFVPRPFWKVILEVGDPPFVAVATNGPFWDREGAEATRALANLDSEAVVEEVRRSEVREHPPPPMNTTAFLAEASRGQRISAPRAMALAQSLYQRGEISYPRTDNTVYPPALQLRPILESLRESAYRVPVERILALPEIRASRGPRATTDHPPIHPVAPPSKPHTGLLWIAYDLIVRRFLATLSPAAVMGVTTVRLRLGDAEFLAQGKTRVEPGWRSLYPEPEPADLPPLHEGAMLPVRGLRLAEERTRPRPLHTQGSLVQAMERLDLGTKSTRHEILGTLLRREYVEGRSLRSTEAGRTVVDALSLYASELVSPAMTHHLEERMSAIAEGRASLRDVVGESRAALHAALVNLRAHEASIARWLQDALYLQRDFGPCDTCASGRLVRRRSRGGGVFLGCSEYPACRRHLRLPPSAVRHPWALAGQASAVS